LEMKSQIRNFLDNEESKKNSTGTDIRTEAHGSAIQMMLKKKCLL